MRTPRQKRDDSWPLISANRHAYDIDFPIPPDLAARIAALEAQKAALEAELAALHVSTSWKVTAPLRWLATKLRTPNGAEPAPDRSNESLKPPATYAEWLRRAEAPCPKRSEIRDLGQRRVRAPRIGLVLLGTVAPEAPKIASATCQVLALPEGSGQAVIDAALAQMDVEHICFLDAADQLEPDAIACAADALAREPALDVVFADEDWLDAAGGRVRPFLKPGWDEDLQRGTDLLGPFTFLRTSLIRPLAVPAGPAWRYELASRVALASRPERIRHIPMILCHRRTQPAGEDAARLAIVQAGLEGDGIAAQVRPIVDMPGWRRVIYPVPQPLPRVSVIVPSRDRADLLSVCAEGVLHGTAYDNLELLIVDNGTSEPDALGLLASLAEDRRVRVLRQPGAFNWAALNNHAAAAAAGDILVLLNNDIALHRREWLTELVGQAVRPAIGAVRRQTAISGRAAAACRSFHRVLDRHTAPSAPPCAR